MFVIFHDKSVSIKETFESFQALFAAVPPDFRQLVVPVKGQKNLWNCSLLKAIKWQRCKRCCWCTPFTGLKSQLVPNCASHILLYNDPVVGGGGREWVELRIGRASPLTSSAAFSHGNKLYGLCLTIYWFTDSFQIWESQISHSFNLPFNFFSLLMKSSRNSSHQSVKGDHRIANYMNCGILNSNKISRRDWSKNKALYRKDTRPGRPVAIPFKQACRNCKKINWMIIVAILLIYLLKCTSC